MIISVMSLSWKQVTSSVPQTSVLDPLLFSIISDLYDWAEHSLSKFAGDTKVGGVAARPEDLAAMCRDIDRLERWADLTKFNNRKCKVLHLQQPLMAVHAGGHPDGNELAKKNIEVLMDAMLDMSQWCSFVAKKANGTLI